MRAAAGRLAALALGLACAGCATYTRGVLAAAASTVPPIQTELVAPGVEGRSCGAWIDVRYQDAVDHALAQAPGANALVDVTSTFERFCIVVRGDAVRIP